MDLAGTVHEMSGVLPRDFKVYPSRIKSLSGECRTTCGLRLGSDHYHFSFRAVSCMYCIAGEFIGWREAPTIPPKDL